MLRILLIDDNPQDRILAVRALKREYSYLQVEQIARLEEFTQALETGHFDLVITDYQLRWSDGLTVLRFIKSRYPSCPVIMFTNSATQETAVEAMKSGLDDYVVKSPKHYVRLPAVTRSVLERVAVQQKVGTMENRFQTLLNQLNVGVFRLTLDGCLLESNPAFRRLLGSESLVEAQAVQPLASYFQPEIYAQMLNPLKQNEPICDCEVQLQRVDGSSIWVRLSTTFSTIDGQTVVDGLMEDISEAKHREAERQQTEDKLRQQALALEQANRIKDDFLAVLSHELRSPLTAILGWAKVLQKNKCDEATTARALLTIERNARSQAQLVEDLLDISRIIRGQLRLNVYPVDLVTVIEAAIDTVRPAADAKQIQLQTVLDPMAGAVSGDSGRLQQVVWNLLINAVKFTPKGGRVEIRLARINSHVEITVIDTGCGIGDEFLPYIFERFRQGDNSITRPYGGLGLGLAIVRQLVELHGGTVHVTSPGVGLGATFVVKLPLMTINTPLSDSGLGLTTVGDGLSTSCSSRLDGLRVLVVDDEADIRELLKQILTEYGSEVVAVASANAAISALSEQTNILVSDISMPGEDGYALLRRVRSLSPERGGQVPALALTAYARMEDRRNAFLAGFQSHIAKPVEPDVLIAAIANLARRTGGKSSESVMTNVERR